MEISVEIKSHGETRTISTRDWKEPLYMRKPGTCKISIQTAYNLFHYFSDHLRVSHFQFEARNIL